MTPATKAAVVVPVIIIIYKTDCISASLLHLFNLWHFKICFSLSLHFIYFPCFRIMYNMSPQHKWFPSQLFSNLWTIWMVCPMLKDIEISCMIFSFLMFTTQFRAEVWNSDRNQLIMIYNQNAIGLYFCADVLWICEDWTCVLVTEQYFWFF